MNPIFQFPTYLLKRQAIALTGKFRFYDPAGRLVIGTTAPWVRPHIPEVISTPSVVVTGSSGGSTRSVR